MRTEIIRKLAKKYTWLNVLRPLNFLFLGVIVVVLAVSNTARATPAAAQRVSSQLLKSGTSHRAPNQTSPERSRYKVRAFLPPSGFEYLDAAMAHANSASLKARLLDDVFQWLRREKFTCLVTNNVYWSGRIGSARGRQFGIKRFVIECRGNCQGVRYGFTPGTSPVRPRVQHYGMSKPYPVLEFKSSLFGYDDFEWRFLREDVTKVEPEIRIHAWSDRWGDYGPGCKIN